MCGCPNKYNGFNVFMKLNNLSQFTKRSSRRTQNLKTIRSIKQNEYYNRYNLCAFTIYVDRDIKENFVKFARLNDLSISKVMENCLKQITENNKWNALH